MIADCSILEVFRSPIACSGADNGVQRVGRLKSEVIELWRIRARRIGNSSLISHAPIRSGGGRRGIGALSFGWCDCESDFWEFCDNLDSAWETQNFDGFGGDRTLQILK